MNSLPIKKIKFLIRDQTKQLSAAHGFGHLKRTAVGARWFARCFGSSNEEQEIAYLAGLIHDLKRPLTEKIDHSDLSVYEAEKVLDRFQVEQKMKKKILALISAHRDFRKTPFTSQWVFLADKLLEQSGAYLIFRRSYYIGECEDFKNTPFVDAALSHWRIRMSRFPPEKFDKRVRELVAYQFKWQEDFVAAFSQKKVWAFEVAKTFFDYGREGRNDLEDLIENYQPKSLEEEKVKRETLDYVAGKKYSQFNEMLVL